jgi:hypothetical protein
MWARTVRLAAIASVSATLAVILHCLIPNSNSPYWPIYSWTLLFFFFAGVPLWLLQIASVHRLQFTMRSLLAAMTVAAGFLGVTMTWGFPWAWVSLWIVIGIKMAEDAWCWRRQIASTSQPFRGRNGLLDLQFLAAIGVLHFSFRSAWTLVR